MRKNLGKIEIPAGYKSPTRQSQRYGDGAYSPHPIPAGITQSPHASDCFLANEKTPAER